jgi:RHS repeat-associated protein
VARRGGIRRGFHGRERPGVGLYAPVRAAGLLRSRPRRHLHDVAPVAEGLARPCMTTSACPLTFSLIEPPDGMTIEPDSGLLSWTPADPGEYTVALRVTDDGVPAKSGFQVYRLTVSPPNLPPRITSQPPREALVGVTYRYRVEAQDPNGHDVLFALTAAPQGMWIDANTGVITWEPTPQQAEDPNEHAVAVLADDRFGGTDTQEYVVTVRTDREPPVVQIVARPNPGMIDQLVEVCVRATDNGKVIRRALTVADKEVDLNDAGCYIFTPEELGIIPMVATAMDGAENVGESSLSYQVVDPYDPTAPEVRLHGPAPESVLTEPTPVIATITDNTPETLVWELRLIRNNTAPTIVLARGEGEVENAEIAVLDPTVLPNDPYALWLFADDGVHQVSTGYFVNIEGEFKPGRFTMTFTDMTVPVAGFPLSIVRRYDSFEATVGDFGPGRRLDFPGDVKDDAEEYPTFQALRAGSKVFVTRPDGRRVGFLAFAEPIHPLFSFIVRLSFIPEADVTEELEVVGAADAYFNFSGYLYEGFTNPFNPSTYRLRLRSGIEYVIDEETGLKSIKDVNGNLITVSPEGLLSSTGPGIRTVRDGEGRIIRAIEPDDDPNDETPPGEVAYEYDADTGNLVAVVDQGNSRTTCRYDEPRRPRYLTEIIDPLGRRGIRNEYSADGRLMKTIDANGREITYNYELGDRQEEIVDRNGARVVLNYDERGNVLLRTDDLGNQTRYDYNEDNRLTRQVDCFEGEDEHEKLFAYNERGDLILETNCTGGRTTYTRDRRGQPLTRTDALGNTTTFEYDDEGNVLREIAPDGSETTHTYDEWGQTLTTTNPLGDTERFAYDRFGRMTAHVDFAGARTEYTYSVHGDRLTETMYRTPAGGGDPEPITTRYVYDENHRQVGVTDALGYTTRSRYDAAGQLWRTWDPLDNMTEHAYDVLGNLVQVRHPDGTTEEYGYDPEGRRTRFTNRGGFTTRYEYDSLGRLVRAIYPDDTPEDPDDNPYTESIYDCLGRIKESYDERRDRTYYEYDCSPNRQLVTDALGHVTVYDFDLVGNRVRMTDALQHTVRYLYDEQGRQIQTIYHDDTRSETRYDAAGRKERDIDPEGKVTRYEHDPTGRLTAVIMTDDGKDLITRYTYDELGNQLTQTDAEGRGTRFDYDVLSRRTRRILPLGHVETTSYDPAGRRSTHTDFNGDTMRYEYDAVGRLVRETTPDGGYHEYAYNGTGQRTLERIVAPNEEPQDTVKEYDARDRLVRVDNPDGSSLDYGHDAAGNRTLLITTTPHLTQTTIFEFDELNRLWKVHHPDDGGTSTYTYDAVGNRERLTLPNGTVATYEYDALNRLTFLTNRRADETIISRYGYTLSPSGQRTRVDETTPDGNQRVVAYSYDDVDRLTGESITDPEHDDLDFTYSYDKVGNRLARVVVGPEGRTTTLYTYDANDRLLAEVDTTQVAGAERRTRRSLAAAGVPVPSRHARTFARGALIATLLPISWLVVLFGPSRRGMGIRASRRRTRAQTVALMLLPVMLLSPETVHGAHMSAEAYAAYGDPADAGREESTTVYTYDDNGNTLSRSKGPQADIYTWDYRNRLVAAENRTTEEQSDATFDYDADGIRVAKEVAGESSVDLLTDKNRDYAQVLTETTVSNDESVRSMSYVHGDDLLAMVQPTHASTYYHHDGQMSTRQLTDASGNLTDYYSYEAFGEAVHHDGPSPNLYQFAGEQRDLALGFYYLCARYYDQNTGTFASADPVLEDVAEPRALHRYLYAGANPVFFRDPSGLTLIGYGLNLAQRTAIAACKLQALRDGIVAMFAPIVFFFAIQELLVWLKWGARAGMGLNKSWPLKGSFIEKVSIRGWGSIDGPTGQLAVDFKKGRIRVSFNGRGDLTGVSGGGNRTLYEHKVCKIEVFKLELLGRLRTGAARIKVGLQATVLRILKVELASGRVFD